MGSVTVPDGLRVEPHELATAEKLKTLGYDVVFNGINNEVHAKNPDLTVNGEFWELKSPRGTSERSTIQDQFKKAQRQARIAVIDLQRCGLPDDLALRQIRRRFHGQKRTIRMFVFDHEGRVTELNHDDNL